MDFSLRALFGVLACALFVGLFVLINRYWFYCGRLMSISCAVGAFALPTYAVWPTWNADHFMGYVMLSLLLGMLAFVVWPLRPVLSQRPMPPPGFTPGSPGPSRVNPPVDLPGAPDEWAVLLRERKRVQ